MSMQLKTEIHMLTGRHHTTY